MKGMIRNFRREDLGAVMEIWLESNLQAHDFISPAYWEQNAGAVREMIPNARVLVLEEDREILGFIGLDGSYIAGLFVRASQRSRGLGKRLLRRAMEERDELSLDVYQKNEGALRFYQREEFCTVQERRDPLSGEVECRMVWQKKPAAQG